MACIYIFVSAAIHVNRIPISFDKISHFYIAELITHMAEVWKQLILHLSVFEHLLQRNMFVLVNLFVIPIKESTRDNLK